MPSLELIVVDNASTDNTDEVVARFSGDSRLRYYKNPTNIGLAPNHNRGLELARGKYILFVSADDKLLPGHLRRCYDYLEAHPAIDMVYTGVVFINAESRSTTRAAATNSLRNSPRAVTFRGRRCSPGAVSTTSWGRCTS